MAERYLLLIYIVIYLMIAKNEVSSLDNGLARLPPMGWLSWVRYTCQIDCDTYPDDCISENLYKRMAELIVKHGYNKLGYQYVNIDDCWSERKRDPITNKLIADRKRFPNGIKALADYVHERGLKLGLYTDIGNATCAGYPALSAGNGSTGDYFDLDARTFAEWEIDSIKVDGCNADIDQFIHLYPRFGLALNLTGRPILYTCSWPAYFVGTNRLPRYAAIAKSCNTWRNFDDISDSWPSIETIINFYADNQTLFAKYHGPGAWFDPDMLVIGNFGLSYEQSKAQMAIWSIFSAPLLMSNNLEKIDEKYKRILQNKYLIAVNQDKYGFLGQRVIGDNKSLYQVYLKPVEPIVNGTYSFAVVYLNRDKLGTPVFLDYPLKKILKGMKIKCDYFDVYDLFHDYKHLYQLSIHERLVLKVNFSGSVRMVKLVPGHYTYKSTPVYD